MDRNETVELTLDELGAKTWTSAPLRQVHAAEALAIALEDFTSGAWEAARGVDTGEGSCYASECSCGR